MIRKYKTVKDLLPHISEIYADYLVCSSLEETAIKYDTVNYILRKLFVNNGLKTVRGYLKYKCNDNFFSNENEKSFYWAGFIAADGCVRKSSKNSRVLILRLADKDAEHVTKFKNDLNSDSPIFKRFFTDKTPQHSIQITSSKIYNDLARFNIVPRKTLIYKFPKWLINHPLMHHFLRGYIDGDGCFRSRLRGKCKKLHVFMSLRGTESFLTSVQFIFENIVKLNNKISIVFDCKVGKIEYGGNPATSKITEFLYKDATIFLQRKYEIAKKSLEIITDRTTL